MADPAASVRDAVDLLRESAGCSAWLTGGTLMSAVRHGEVGPPGDPLTVAYLADRPGTVATLEQSFRVVRSLRAGGVRAEPTGDGRLTLDPAGGGRDVVSVQPCWRVDDALVLWPGVRVPAGADAVLPLGAVTAAGISLPSPADPAQVLEALYGERWQTLQRPYRLRPHGARAAAERGRGLARHRRRWERFYRGYYGTTAPDQPSSFGRWVAQREQHTGDQARLVVDAGCGNGRDTALFAERGQAVLAFDYAPAACAATRCRLDALHAGADVRTVDLYDMRSTLLLGAEIRTADRPVVLYARFVAHALEDDGRDNLWRLSATSLRGGGRLYLEFRTDRDATAPHVFQDQHFRRYLDVEQVETELRRYGGTVAYREEGYGLAPYLFEDPHVCRMVVEWAS